MHVACREGHLPIVNHLIDKGANLEASVNDGLRPLHVAAYHGHLEIVKYLITKDVDMNALTNNGESALGIARRRRNHPKTVDFLCTRGAVDDGIDENNEAEEGDDEDDSDNEE